MAGRSPAPLPTGRALPALVLPPTPAAAPARHPGAHAAPKTVVLDGSRLVDAKQRLKQGDPVLRRSLADLVKQADGWLKKGPWTVTDKTQVPPSGDKHDYLSQAPYWWPTEPKTADNPWGCPYVQKDGQRNPDVDLLTDHEERGDLFVAVPELALAWYYTGKAGYARHAADILRT